MKNVCLMVLLSTALPVFAQPGYYSNPILHADYSDPDAIRVGSDYYMTASSFNAVPGLPILHSKDLVHWRLLTYALPRLQPEERYRVPQHGNGVWAPSIRYFKGQFHIYYPDPDLGIFLIRSKRIEGPWSVPVLVEAGAGLIDPCPLLDDNGQLYLVHAYAGSRAGFKSVLVVKPLNPQGDKVTGPATLIYDGHGIDPTVEGPKIYKRNGYYYVFAPAGGVEEGWQIVLRSRHITGPYERKVVMHQGTSPVNGPHQGAWVQTPAGEDWFLHFQDKGAYGRIVHLQPMQWKNGWPVIGNDPDGDGTGEPVLRYRIPASGTAGTIPALPATDECNSAQLGLQWQWHANPGEGWAMPFPARGVLRLNSVLQPPGRANLWEAPNLLLQKLPAESFTATALVHFHPKKTGDRFGLLLMGSDYAAVVLEQGINSLQVTGLTCIRADKGGPEQVHSPDTLASHSVYLRLQVRTGGEAVFSYSTEGTVYRELPMRFKAVKGRWIGAKMGFFCNRTAPGNDSGYADVDWFRVEVPAQ